MPGSAAHRRGSPVSIIAAGGAAVIRAVERHHLVAAGVPPRDLDRVLVRLGAAVGEEEHLDVARADLGELAPEPRARLGGHERIGVGERFGLLLHGADDALVAVADVDAHQLAVEVEVPLPFGRPEPAALRPRDGDRIDGPLRRPLEERVLLREVDDRLAAQARHGSSTVFISAPGGTRSLHFVEDRLADVARAGFAAEIGRARPVAGSTRSIAPTMRSCPARRAEVIEHQRAGPDRADRIRNALARDVGRRSMYRLEHRRVAPLGIDISARRDAEAARNGGAEVGQDVAEQVRRDDHVDAAGIRDHPRDQRVDVILAPRHRRVVLPDPIEHLVPQHHR